ncbi:MAG TPA: MBL fold metallo-hydrolase [Aggregatilineales bacterium]|nr:MBL fold metallo-hydrolase [Aggregatilineales bacterium]
MKIKWYGHACVRAESDDGISVIMEPYTPATCGYDPIKETADIVITSSANDTFHCRADLIPGDHIDINALELARNGGERVEKGITFKSIGSMEALNHRYHAPDAMAMYRFNIDGIHVGHLGDMGNPLSAEELQFFEGLDILLALAGGHPTIELDDLKTLIDTVQPKLVIPTHFRTLAWKPRTTLWIESFLSYFDNADVDFAFTSTVRLKQDDLPEKTRVLVLDYIRS